MRCMVKNAGFAECRGFWRQSQEGFSLAASLSCCMPSPGASISLFLHKGTGDSFQSRAKELTKQTI